MRHFGALVSDTLQGFERQRRSRRGSDFNVRGLGKSLVSRVESRERGGGMTGQTHIGLDWEGMLAAPVARPGSRFDRIPGACAPGYWRSPLCGGREFERRAVRVGEDAFREVAHTTPGGAGAGTNDDRETGRIAHPTVRRRRGGAGWLAKPHALGWVGFDASCRLATQVGATWDTPE